MKGAISVEQLGYAYPDAAAPALRNVSLQIAPGEFIVLAGGSGSGKSTLLSAMAGLVPHFHGGDFGGSVEVAGLSTRQHGPGQLAAHVGSLFQDPETQVVMGGVRAELAFAPENLGFTPAQVARAVEETALSLGIDGLLERTTAELSGGELQRVALAATLTARPGIVCLDEPTSQLDPVAGDELIALLRRLNDDSDLTIVLSEHRLERCLPFADRVLALDGGALVFDGRPAEFLSWALRTAPALATPAAQILDAVGLPPEPSVKRARAALRSSGLNVSKEESDGRASATASRSSRRPSRRTRDSEAAFSARGVWHELKGGRTILRGVSLTIQRGERVALMGRNGAGKSTLLRHMAGLMKPTRGKLETGGRVALLLQNPGDYLVHERVADEAPRAALERFGLIKLGERHPRELSGGERQRLALAIVLGSGGDGDAPALVCLDEPTRGMGRADKQALAQLLVGLDAAVLVATHDPEFAAVLARRVLLMSDGELIADGPATELLCGGTYFSTETARILGGGGGALRPEQGAALLTRALERVPS
jgi:energy-coupling factor transport system ATP-binding protein